MIDQEIIHDYASGVVDRLERLQADNQEQRDNFQLNENEYNVSNAQFYAIIKTIKYRWLGGRQR